MRHQAASTRPGQSLGPASSIRIRCSGPPSASCRALPKRAGDAVLLGGDDHHRALEPGQPGRRVVRLTQQPLHRQPPTVVRRQPGQPVPRRDQHPPRRALGLQCTGTGSDRGPERFADPQQRRAALTVGGCDELAGVADEVRFPRLAGARPVARVLGEDHAEAQRHQCLGIEHAMADLPRVAVEDDRGAAHGAPGLGDQPPEVFCRRPGRESGARHLFDRRPLRAVEQAVPPQVDQRQKPEAGRGGPQRGAHGSPQPHDQPGGCAVRCAIAPKQRATRPRRVMG